MKRIELTGWEISGYYPYVYQLGRMEPRLGSSVTGWLPAEVPGSVHRDLQRAGWIEDPCYDMNSLRCEWVENRWWAYRCRFDVPIAPGRRYRLRMNGLDYKCHIYLNDVFLCLHEGSFDPVLLDVTGAVRPADNTLVIVFESAPDEESQAGHASHTHTQKSRFSYKWDFSTRMVPVGIWDDLWLEETGGVTVDRMQVLPEIREERGRITLRAGCACVGDAPFTLRARVLGPDGRQAAEAAETFRPRDHACEAVLALWIDAPEKWYPHGTGGQPLYRVEVTAEEAGVPSHQWTGRAGFGGLRWIPNEDAPADALPYCMEVWGQRVYLKGVNLTPFDMLIGTVTEERYRRFLLQVRAANINLVRVNGVGLIEKECFYDLCDELGIFVWQEFIQTSSSMDRIPPTDPAYLDLLGRTARSAIEIKRNHVCLACYCGGNELTSAPGVPISLDHPNIAALKALVDALDPGRMLFPSSASGPSEFLAFGREGISHDVHGPWNYRPEEHYALFNQSDSLLHGELGAEGMAHPDSLRRFLKPRDLRVTDMKENPAWRHHGDWWDARALCEEEFGTIPDLDTFVGMSQLTQAEALRYALESNRRRAYHNSGSLMWAFSEPFPNVSNTSLVDYYGVPKMAYYALRSAYAPLHLSMRYDGRIFPVGGRFTGQVWLHNSGPALEAEVRVTLYALDGTPLWDWRDRRSVPGNRGTPLTAVSLPVTPAFGPVFLARLTVAAPGQATDVNEYLFSTKREAPFGALVRRGRDALAWTEEAASGETHTYTVKNNGPGIALCVAPELPGENEFLFSPEAYLSLLPGEERTVRVTAFAPGKHWDRLRFSPIF